jgi:hypothetical protein
MFRVFENRVLMRMFGPKRGNGRIEKIAQNSKLGVMRNACKIQVGKPKGTDGVNRIGYSWGN